MRNSKILKVALCSAIVASLAATAALSASATTIDTIGEHKVGVVGSFNGWADDVILTDDDNDGVYDTVIDLPSVEADWIAEWSNDGENQNHDTVTFKVRLDASWDENWGLLDAQDRIFDSQFNIGITEDVKAGDHIKFRVFLDTTKNNPDAVAAELPDEADVPEWEYLYAGYDQFEVVTDDAAATTDDTPAATTDDTPADEPSTAPADTTSDKDTATPQTGDTTSAVALVAVVLASLGTAVVMTKKASAKD